MFENKTYDLMTSASQSFSMIPHDHPLKDSVAQFMPRNLNELFKMCEFIYSNSPQIASTMNRFISYPITDIEVSSDSTPAADSFEKYLNDILFVKEFLLFVGLNLNIYGNIFVSIRYPFERRLICKSCRSTHIISYNNKSLKINGFYKDTADVEAHCPKCGGYTRHEIKDLKGSDLKDFRPIVWSPKLIKIKHIPIAGKCIYYMQPDAEAKKLVNSCDIDMLREIPLDLIKAIRKGALFRFQENELLHLKLHSLTGMNYAWGMPIFMSAMRQFFFAYSLRSANQSIAMEHLTHHRIIFPSSAGDSMNLLKTMGSAVWKKEVQKLILGKRFDPNFIGISPVPLGMVDLGGNGKMLLTSQELKMAEENINLSFGFPIEFLQGNLATNASLISLKVLERELTRYVGNMNRMLRWIADKFSKHFRIDNIKKVELLEFKLTDDINLQQLLMMERQNGDLSDETYRKYTGLKIDPETEREKIIDESLNRLKTQKDMAKKQQEMETDLNQKIEAAMNQPQGGGINKEQMMAMADQEADYLLQLDTPGVQSRLLQLQKDDNVFYFVVKGMYEQKKRATKG